MGRLSVGEIVRRRGTRALYQVSQLTRDYVQVRLDSSPTATTVLESLRPPQPSVLCWRGLDFWIRFERHPKGGV